MELGGWPQLRPCLPADGGSRGSFCGHSVAPPTSGGPSCSSGFIAAVAVRPEASAGVAWRGVFSIEQLSARPVALSVKARAWGSWHSAARTLMRWADTLWGGLLRPEFENCLWCTPPHPTSTLGHLTGSASGPVAWWPQRPLAWGSLSLGSSLLFLLLQVPGHLPCWC